LKTRLTLEARIDLANIRDYIAEDDPAAAERVLARLQQTILLLGDFPKIGPRWKKTDEQVFSVSGLPYRIHYRVDPDNLLILTIVHTRRNFP